MEKKDILSTFRVQLLESPLALFCFVLFSQGVLSLSLIFLSLPATKRHGAQAFLSPEDASVMEGQKVYYQEGCQYCHTQGLRPFTWELKRFTQLEKLGHFPAPDAMEYYFESPFPRGTRRIGPDLARAASLYTDVDLRSLLKNKGAGNFKKLTHQYAYLFEKEKIESPYRQDSSESQGAVQDFEWNPTWNSAWKIRFMLQMNLPLSEPYQRSFLAKQELSRGELLIAYLLSRGKKHIQFKGKYYRKK